MVWPNLLLPVSTFTHSELYIWSSELFKFGVYTQCKGSKFAYDHLCPYYNPQKIKIIPFNVSFMKRTRTMKYYWIFYERPLF